MPRIFNLQRLILASAAFAIMVVASSTTLADPITITVGNPATRAPTTSYSTTAAWFIPACWFRATLTVPAPALSWISLRLPAAAISASAAARQFSLAALATYLFRT